MMKHLRDICVLILPVLVTSIGSQAGMAQNRAELVEVAHSDQQWTGVAVSQEGRIFVNFPRWSPRVTMAVAEVFPDGTRETFPDADWNAWQPGQSPREHLICVQSVYVDADNFLWILDPANPEFKGVVNGGPKLVKVDLHTNQVVQTIFFNGHIAPGKSYLNDVRVDTKNGVAYITDSGMAALVVVDLKTSESRRVLTDDTSTRSEGTRIVIDGKPWQGLPNGSQDVHADGLALDPDGKFLFFHALTATTLQRIETRWLRDSSLSEAGLAAKVQILGKTGPTDGMEVDRYGNIYLSAIEENAIKRFTSEHQLDTVVQDERLAWPDSFAWKGEWLYVTTSQIQFGQKPPGPYRLFKLKPGLVVTPTGRSRESAEPK
jgi:sugar lactone lactonase YvrE